MIEKYQVWTLKEGSEDACVKILQIDEDETIHISVIGARYKDQIFDIEHIPISKLALMGSLAEGKEDDTSMVLPEGYMDWKSNNGGVWDLPLDEVINHIGQSIWP